MDGQGTFAPASRIAATRIRLRDVAVDAIIGVFAHEQERVQPLVVSVSVDVERVQSEQLSSTLDYRDILDGILRTAGNPHALIETFASHLGQLLLEHPLAIRVDVEVEKPQAVANGIAGVTCTILDASE